MNRYGTGWHWSPLGDGRSALVPMSTQYETPSLRWRHAETCAVDRVSGLGCTCICTTTAAKGGESSMKGCPHCGNTHPMPADGGNSNCVSV